MLARFAFAASLLLAASVAWADPRPFTFVYDTYREGAGNWEYEQYVTWRDSSRFDFRHEVEFGITDNFDLSIIVADWRYEDSNERTGTKFNSAGAEGILYFSNPVTDVVGSGFYFEFAVGEGEMEFE